MSTTEPALNRIWQVYTKEKDSLTLGVYNQRPGFTLFRKEGGAPPFKISFGIGGWVLVREIIRTVLKSSGEIKLPFIATSFDPVTRQSSNAGQLTFVKDDRGLYHIEVSNKAIGVIDFTLRCESNFNISGDGLSQSKKSELMLQGLLDMLNAMPTAMFISPKMVPKGGNAGGGNRFGGGSNGGGGSARPAEDAALFGD